MRCQPLKAAKLLGLKKLTIRTPVGTGNTWLDDIRVAPCQLVDFPALALTREHAGRRGPGSGGGSDHPAEL